MFRIESPNGLVLLREERARISIRISPRSSFTPCVKDLKTSLNLFVLKEKNPFTIFVVLLPIRRSRR